MDWDIFIHHENFYVEIVTRGVADNDGAMRMAKVISETMRKHKITKAVIDHRNVTGVSGAVADVYERPTFFRLVGMILGIKIAEIIQPEHLKFFKFLETVCVNRGFKFSIFYTKDEAMEWLFE